jgi:hypothetical protein
MIGVDTSPLNIRFDAEKPLELKRPEPLEYKPKIEKKNVVDLRDDYELSLGKATTKAIQYLHERIPGDHQDIEIMVQDDLCVLAPSLVPDDGNSAGTLRRAKDEGYELATPLYSVDKPHMIVGAALRNVIPEKKLKDKPKALNSYGSYGGSYGSTMGQLDKALENAEHHKKLVICEGILDYLTLATCFINYHVGVAGVHNVKKIVQYLADQNWKGKIVCVVDNDDGSDKAFLDAARAAKKAGIEFCDGRPPKRGHDINDHFCAFGGGSDGARALISLIDGAQPYIDDQENAEEEERLEAKRKTKEILAELSIKLRAQAEAKRKLKREKNKRCNFLKAAKILRRIHLDYGDSVSSRIAKIMIFSRAELSSAATYKIFRLAKISGYRWMVEQAIDNPITNKSPQSTVHYLISKTTGMEVHKLFIELARVLALPIAPYLKGLGFFHGVDRQDKAFLLRLHFQEGEGYKKLSAWGDCGAFYREYTLEGLDLENADNASKTNGLICNSSLCGHCYGSYIADQQTYEDHSSWDGKFITGVIAVPKNTPGAASAAWKEAAALLRGVPMRATFIPECQGLGYQSGILFVARYTERDHELFQAALQDVEILESFQALDKFVLAQLVLPLSMASRAIRHDDSLVEDPWLDRVQLGRQRNAPDFSWISIRNWKSWRAALDTKEDAELRPMTISTYHGDSKILIDRRSNQDPGKAILQQYEVIIKANRNDELQSWIDNECLANLPRYLGEALVANRKKWRERAKSSNAAREAKEQALQEAAEERSLRFSSARHDFATTPT